MMEDGAAATHSNPMPQSTLFVLEIPTKGLHFDEMRELYFPACRMEFFQLVFTQPGMCLLRQPCKRKTQLFTAKLKT